jgi:hypothetical protein
MARNRWSLLQFVQLMSEIRIIAPAAGRRVA